MKAILYLLGILAIVAAIVYFVVPSDSLPSFMPGHVAASNHIHVKHGIVAAAVGVILLAIGAFAGRRG